MSSTVNTRAFRIHFPSLVKACVFLRDVMGMGLAEARYIMHVNDGRLTNLNYPKDFQRGRCFCSDEEAEKVIGYCQNSGIICEDNSYRAQNQQENREYCQMLESASQQYEYAKQWYASLSPSYKQYVDILCSGPVAIG